MSQRHVLRGHWCLNWRNVRALRRQHGHRQRWQLQLVGLRTVRSRCVRAMRREPVSPPPANSARRYELCGWRLPSVPERQLLHGGGRRVLSLSRGNFQHHQRFGHPRLVPGVPRRLHLHNRLHRLRALPGGNLHQWTRFCVHAVPGRHVQPRRGRRLGGRLPAVPSVDDERWRLMREGRERDFRELDAGGPQ